MLLNKGISKKGLILLAEENQYNAIYLIIQPPTSFQLHAPLIAFEEFHQQAMNNFEKV